MSTLAELMSADQQASAAPAAAPTGMKWGGGKLPKELLQQYEAQAAQGKPEVAAMLQSYYQANPQNVVMPKSGTLADFMTADQQATQQTTQQTAQVPQQSYTPSNIDVNAQAQARLQRQGAAPPQYKSAVGQAFQDAFDNLVMRPKDPGILANAIGAGEAGLTTASGALAYPLGAVAGIGGTLLSGKYGTQEGIQAGNEVAGNVASALTYQPRTQQGQGIVQNLQQLFETSKLPSVGLPEAAGFAPVVGAASEQARNLKEPPQALGLQTFVQPGIRPASEVPAVMRKPANMTPQQLANMQATFEAKKAGLAAPVVPVVTPSAAPSVAPVSMATAGSAGAAAASDAARISELLTRASPELKNATKEIIDQGGQVNPLQLENRVKAEQFGMKLTEGEASQDLAKLSEEANSVKTNPAMADHLAENNKKLAQSFQDVRSTVAPDVYEPDPVKASNIALENIVQQDANRKKSISANYQAAADANGGQLPLNGADFVKEAETQLNKTSPNLYRFVPPKIQNILDDLKTTGKMSYDDFEFYKTIFDNERRLAERQGDKTTALAISKVLQGLEATPMSEASAPVKALYDTARKSAKERFDLIEQNPAYKAAISDTRTLDEISQGVLHPAANKFIDNFYGPKTPQVNINRLVNVLGQNSESHQGLNAAVIDKIAQASGVKGGANDVVRQSALNNQVRSVYKTNLPSMLSAEGLQKLHDLADVSALVEHNKIGGYANVSKTAIAQTPSPVGQFVKKGAETLLHGALVANNPVLGFAYGAAKEGLKSRAARKAAEAEAIAQAEKNAAPFKEGAGITYKLNDIKNLGSK